MRVRKEHEHLYSLPNLPDGWEYVGDCLLCVGGVIVSSDSNPYTAFEIVGMDEYPDDNGDYGKEILVSHRYLPRHVPAMLQKGIGRFRYLLRIARDFRVEYGQAPNRFDIVLMLFSGGYYTLQMEHTTFRYLNGEVPERIVSWMRYELGEDGRWDG